MRIYLLLIKQTSRNWLILRGASMVRRKSGSWQMPTGEFASKMLTFIACIEVRFGQRWKITRRRRQEDLCCKKQVNRKALIEEREDRHGELTGEVLKTIIIEGLFKHKKREELWPQNMRKSMWTFTLRLSSYVNEVDYQKFSYVLLQIIIIICGILVELITPFVTEEYLRQSTQRMRSSSQLSFEHFASQLSFEHFASQLSEWGPLVNSPNGICNLLCDTL